MTLHRGNVDSIFPNSSEAQERKANGTLTDAPSLSSARVLEVPDASELLGTGDVDVDGHPDVVAAAREVRPCSGFACHIMKITHSRVRVRNQTNRRLRKNINLGGQRVLQQVLADCF